MRTEKKEILDEIKKCQESPYYFATTYLKVNNKPFITPLSERQFNQYFFQGRMINEEEWFKDLKFTLWKQDNM